ncbi:hypothetical protein XA68_14453 [Ophiocordyceps unilateralis]|uniref:Uncharacterized protein n=1 Tax=Ophiocordyceps unilateralis TaxID=268505 RepID=A0A2A9PAD8_OPHUN|nr:hypothetical protein XA68_14453 [Ophiocordyceps unilateralis]
MLSSRMASIGEYRCQTAGHRPCVLARPLLFPETLTSTPYPEACWVGFDVGQHFTSRHHYPRGLDCLFAHGGKTPSDTTVSYTLSTTRNDEGGKLEKGSIISRYSSEQKPVSDFTSSMESSISPLGQRLSSRSWCELHIAKGENVVDRKVSKPLCPGWKVEERRKDQQMARTLPSAP